MSSGAVSRAPAPDVQSPPGLSFSLREDGRLDVVARGPQLPGVGKPAAGLRRNVDGTFTVVFGADEKVVAPSEVPPMLRGMVETMEKHHGVRILDEAVADRGLVLDDQRAWGLAGHGFTVADPRRAPVRLR